MKVEEVDRIEGLEKINSKMMDSNLHSIVVADHHHPLVILLGQQEEEEEVIVDHLHDTTISSSMY